MAPPRTQWVPSKKIPVLCILHVQPLKDFVEGQETDKK
jgi:hypothetical protein